MTFGRPQPATGCARCIELASGAPARTWRGRGRSVGYPTAKEINAHDCKTAGCMAVCTFGDW
jgi:hypothetical protein